MATGLNGALADSLLNVLRNIPPTLYGSTVYVQLHVGDPGAAGTASISAGSTTRQSGVLAAPSSHGLGLTASPAAWTNSGTSETLTHVSVWSAATGGTFLFSAILSPTQPWLAGNQFTLNTLLLSFAGIAA